MREGGLLFLGQMLIGKNQQRVVEPGAIEILPRCFIDAGELDAGDDGAEGGVERFDFE